MTFEETDEYEFMYRWTDDSTVHIGHFIVKGGFRQGTGNNAFQEICERFSEEGATKIIVNIGGGKDTEDFLKEQGFEIIKINSDGHVRAEKELN